MTRTKAIMTLTDTADHLALVAKRQADPGLFVMAERRVQAIQNLLRAKNVNAMAIALQDEPTRTGKVIWLNHILDTLHDAASGFSPCKAGCSDCCSMALNITQDEAKAIAMASGRTALVPVYDDDTEDAIKRYEGVPCPMLVDGLCSVYAVRPLACRVHYSVDSDALLCKIVRGANIRSPTLDTQRFQMLGALTYANPLSVRFADIREYFQ
jgi:Fe-S-cluster containining protein